MYCTCLIHIFGIFGVLELGFARDHHASGLDAFHCVRDHVIDDSLGGQDVVYGSRNVSHEVVTMEVIPGMVRNY